MTARVSVVIPHYNRSDLLDQALASALKSGKELVEVIVVDDGSTRDHLERAERLSSDRVQVLSRVGEPKGPSRCRNQGVDASAAELVIFLDSDDLMAPWCIEQRLTAAAAMPDADLWVFPVMLFDQKPGDMPHLWNRMQNGVPPELRFMRSDPPWHTSSPLWRRDALLRVGGFNENIFYGDDSDLHMRAIVEGLKASLHDDALPDAFIRRSAAQRITNSPDSLASSTRAARLREGTRYLRGNPALRRLLPIWEGQYFQEAEYFLFNERDPGPRIEQVLAQWEDDFRPDSRPPLAATAYLSFALRCRTRAYAALRAARRLAMKALPDDFFSLAPDFQSLVASQDVQKEVARLL